VLQVARSLAATLGEDFFEAEVKHLAEAFHADFSYLGEFIATPVERIRTLATWGKPRTVKHLDQELGGTAAGQVIANGFFVCGTDVQLIFPEDERLGKLFAEGYAGIRLSDPKGQPIGLLAVISRRPLVDTDVVKSVLEAFSPRTAAELARKRADDLHRENEERYHAFVASNPDAMWRIEFEQPVPLTLSEDDQLERIYRFGYVAECNDALAQIAGRTVSQLTGARLAELAPPSDANIVKELRAAIRSEFHTAQTETTIHDVNGRQLHRLRSLFGIVENGKLRRLWGAARDITDLRRAEGSAKASERWFREVLEGVHLAAVMLNPQGGVIFCNQLFMALTGRSKAELDAIDWLDGVIPAGESQMWRDAMLSGQDRRGATAHFEGAIISHGGKPRVIQWDTICLHNQDGEFVALAAVGRDLTDQKALETRIREAQKLDGIGRLAAGVAHDFNNLLTVIVGQVEQLQEQLTEDDLGRGCLSQIEHAAKQCAKLSSQLLIFGRRQVLQPEYLNLNDLIAGEKGLIRAMAGEGVDLVLDLAAPPPMVFADRTQLQRVLANLVTNARDAMPDGGTLTIGTSNVEIEKEDPAYPAVRSGSYVRLSVADSGVGLSQEAREHLFEPLFTTKEPGKGTGLGLATVYGIITQSGGYIAVRSEPGKGATFEILLAPALQKA
jgi:PAS domain S-box-containing protein